MPPSTKHYAPSPLLQPFSWLYAAVAAGRNYLYDQGWKASAPGWVPLIGVGNLRVGGTGKTPHVAWVVEELLRQGQRPAILSRGYGRQTKGPRLAAATDSARAGDNVAKLRPALASRCSTPSSASTCSCQRG